MMLWLFAAVILQWQKQYNGNKIMICATVRMIMTQRSVSNMIDWFDNKMQCIVRISWLVSFVMVLCVWWSDVDWLDAEGATDVSYSLSVYFKLKNRKEEIKNGMWCMTVPMFVLHLRTVGTFLVMNQSKYFFSRKNHP